MNILKKTFDPGTLPAPEPPTPKPTVEPTERPRRREFVQPTFRRFHR